MKNKKQPLVSVVMPVYNAGSFLRPAIESILNQTYKNLEFIIVDDASLDNSRKIISEYKQSLAGSTGKQKDRRIKFYSLQKQVGVSKTASFAIEKAKGDFIARMDADDIAYFDRIEKQVSFLQKHPKVVAVGGQCNLIDVYGQKIGEKKFPVSDSKIKNFIFTNVPLQQPSLMVNKKLLPRDFVWYDENYSSAEELELLFKLFKFGRVANLNSYVLKYRIHPKNTSLKNPKKTFFLTLKTRIIAVLKYGYVPSFRGVITTLLQVLFILVMPSVLIYPAYSYLRGMKKVDFSIPKISLPNFRLAFTK